MDLSTGGSSLLLLEGTYHENQSTPQELVVITGASSGICAATAREFARRGFHVLAGTRRNGNGDVLRAANLESIMLDITDEAGIAALVQRIVAISGVACCAR